ANALVSARIGNERRERIGLARRRPRARDHAAREQVGVAVVAHLNDLGRRRRGALERGLGGRRVFALAVAGAELLVVARRRLRARPARGVLGGSGGVGRRRRRRLALRLHAIARPAFLGGQRRRWLEPADRWLRHP